METTKRTIVKALSWQILGLLMMTVISYLHTGSMTSALSLAGTSTDVVTNYQITPIHWL